MSTDPIDRSALIAVQPELRLLSPEVLRAAPVRELKRETPLFRRGDRPGHAWYVISGEIQLVRYSRNGVALILARSLCGFVAEASFDAARYHCDALAVVDTVVLGLPLAAYRDAIDHNAAFRRARFAAQAREIRRLRARGERLALPGAEERLIHYLETEGEDGRVLLDRPLKALALELNLSHEAFYRTLARMARAGTLERAGRTLRLR